MVKRKAIRKSLCDKDLGYTGLREGGLGDEPLCLVIPVQSYSYYMTMMAYIKNHSANNPLLHAIPEQKLAPKIRGNVPA